MATTWQWRFRRISITAKNWTGLWIPSPNLPLLYQMNQIIDFRLQTSLICKKGKKNNIMREVVTRWCSAKKLSWKFLKIHREIPVQQSLSNTVKNFHALRLATLLKKPPSLGFESKPFVDPLENMCSWIIYKTHRKAHEFESLFK